MAQLITNIKSDSVLSQHYPFFDKQIGVGKWELRAIPLLDELQDYMTDPAQQFGWARAKGYRQLWADGLAQQYRAHDMHEFAREVLGIELDPARKGPYVLAKRLARIFGPHRAYAFMPKSELKVAYLDLDKIGEKVWDGFGLVSPAFIEAFADRIPSREREWYTTESECERWEFTIQTSEGQWKGHAIVSDAVEGDFLIPDDCKGEVKLVDQDEAFVAIRPVHGANHMHMDIQSLINLHPFFDNDRLVRWLKEEGAFHLQQVEDGELDHAFSKATVEEDRYWHLADYLQREGVSSWFAGIREDLGMAHIKRLRKRQSKMRLPIPGGRYYIAPAVAGVEVMPGTALIDESKGTLWVSPIDWVEYIAERTGGADHDDAYWTYVFTDYDGEQKILAWRSPNQTGEYILLQPAPGSHIPTWLGEVRMECHDSRLLPTVIEEQSILYLDVLDANVVPPTPDIYDIDVVRQALAGVFANKGVLGRMCNRLMIMQAMGMLDQPGVVLPSRLEDIIDADVKTGASLELVKEDISLWEYWMEEHGVISPVLMERIATEPPIQRIWLDELNRAVEEHIVWYKAELKLVAQKARPPMGIIRAGEPHIALGKAFIRCYTHALNMYKTLYPEPDNQGPVEMVELDWSWAVDDEVSDALREDEDHIIYDLPMNVWEYVYQQSRLFLEAHNPEEVILGTIAHVYSSEATNTMDRMIWQRGKQSVDVDGVAFFAAGINRMTVELLAKYNVILHRDGEHLYQTGERVVDTETEHQKVTINNVWFNYGVATGATRAERPSQVDNQTRDYLKNRTHIVAPQMVKRRIRIEAGPDGRQVASGPTGRLMGYVNKRTPLAVGEYVVELCSTRDGNWNLVVSA